MKLLSAISRTLQSVEFPPQFPYATLSDPYSAPGHDGLHPFDSAALQGMSQQAIIDKACHLALHKGLNHIWIESVCVNRDSRADVSEAINSGWKYFQSAALCLVYLPDLPCRTSQPDEETLGLSRYWSRAWSLQELVFASRICFYDSRWHLRGDTSSEGFSSLLSRVMGIDGDVLAKRKSVREISIARRMSWGGGRISPRAEDLSYALLGIFGIRMPIAYGEGEESAFRRLQEEILRTTSDMTLFAWTSLDDTLPRGIFARSIEEFRSFGQTELASAPFHLDGFATLTSQGVLIRGKCLEQNGDLFLDLGMQQNEHSHAKRCGILIRKSPYGTYHRVSSSMTQMVLADESAKFMQLIVEAGDVSTAETSNDQYPAHIPPPWNLASRQKESDSSSNETVEMSNSCYVSSDDSCFATNESSTFHHSPQPRSLINSPLPEGNDIDWVNLGESWTSSGRLGPFHQESDQMSAEESDYDASMFFTKEATAKTSSPVGKIAEASNEVISGSAVSSNEMGATSEDGISPPQTGNLGDATLAGHLARQAVRHFRKARQINARKIETQKARGNKKKESIGSRRHETSVTKRRRNITQPTDFACPFFVNNPWEHLNCLRDDALNTMSDVRGHLWRSHRVPYHCPICIQTFVSATGRDEHILKRECSLKEYPTFLGVTQDQEDLIQRTQDISGGRYQWFAIWRILFPKQHRKPKSGLLNDTIGAEICEFRAWYKSRGLAWIRNSVEELKDSTGYIEEVEKCATELRLMVLSEAINIFVDDILRTAP